MADETVFRHEVDAETVADAMQRDPNFAFEVLAWLAEKLEWDGAQFMRTGIDTSDKDTDISLLDFHTFIGTLLRGCDPSS
jgi:hypothetical protein